MFVSPPAGGRDGRWMGGRGQMGTEREIDHGILQKKGLLLRRPPMQQIREIGVLLEGGREGGSRGDKRVGWARCQEGNFVAARKMRCCRCIFLTERLFRYISRSNYVIFSFTFPGDIQDEDKLMKASSEKSASTNLYLYQVKKRPEDLARNWEGTIPQ